MFLRGQVDGGVQGRRRLSPGERAATDEDQVSLASGSSVYRKAADGASRHSAWSPLLPTPGAARLRPPTLGKIPPSRESLTGLAGRLSGETGRKEEACEVLAGTIAAPAGHGAPKVRTATAEVRAAAAVAVIAATEVAAAAAVVVTVIAMAVATAAAVVAAAEGTETVVEVLAAASETMPGHARVPAADGGRGPGGRGPRQRPRPLPLPSWHCVWQLRLSPRPRRPSPWQ